MISFFHPQYAYAAQMSNNVQVPHEIMGCVIRDGPEDMLETDGRKTVFFFLFLKFMFEEFCKQRRSHVVN